MKVCLITKYPPIEGGVSSKAYWLAKGLGERGNKVFVVSNAWEVETEYREKVELNDIDFYQPENVHVFNTDPFDNPKHIPFAIPYTEKISSLTMDVIDSYDIDVLDSSYILPYGVAGYLANTFYHLPHLLKHAGSDILRLLPSPYLNTILRHVLLSVDRVITNKSAKNLLIELGIDESRIVIDDFSIDTTAFNPNVRPLDLSPYSDNKYPVITFIGKGNDSKGIHQLIKSLGKVKSDFTFLLVTDSGSLSTIQSTIKKCRLKEKTVILPFAPPWRIPSIIKASTCVVMPERAFPISLHSPVLPRECWATGTCTMLSKELYEKRSFRDIEEETHTIVVEPMDIELFAEKLKSIIRDPDAAKRRGRKALKVSLSNENFPKYIKNRQKLYKMILEEKKVS